MTAFPADPDRGDTHTKRGIQYEWTGTIWRPTDYSAFWESAGDSEMRRTYGPISQTVYNGLTPARDAVYLISG